MHDRKAVNMILQRLFHALGNENSVRFNVQSLTQNNYIGLEALVNTVLIGQ